MRRLWALLGCLALGVLLAVRLPAQSEGPRAEAPNSPPAAEAAPPTARNTPPSGETASTSAGNVANPSGPATVPSSGTATSPAAGSATATSPPANPPTELWPYRVRVDAALDLGLDNAPGPRQSLREEIRQRLHGQIGGFWELEFPDELQSELASPADLPRRTEGFFAPHLNGPNDKIFSLGVSRQGNRWILQAREWDGTLRLLGPVIQRETFERREVAALAVETLRAAFRPLTQIEQTKAGEITLRGRAARIPPHDPAWNPLRNGGVFEPYYRYLNKERQVDKIQRIPWTYLVCGEPVAGEGIAPGQAISGLRTAISARRRRIEAVALGAPLTDIPTVVRLTTRPPNRKPIAGVEIFVRKERNTPPVPEGQSPPPPLTRLVSDRRGELTMPPGLVPPGTPVWLFIYSGSQTLARVPFMPGMRPREELELADDSLRLQVEGDIALLQARLVDQAAQRAVMLALARKRAGEKNFTEASQILRSVSDTFQPAGMLADLNTIRSPALKTARETRDRQTESRVKKLCDDTAEIINAHFGPEKINELRDEFAELKEVANDEARDAADAAKVPGKKTPPRRKLPAPGQPAAPPAETPPAEDTKAAEDSFGQE
ncbi:MAG: hypothetical protein ACK5TO_05735 [Planctomycetaceae bacterium]